MPIDFSSHSAGEPPEWLRKKLTPGRPAAAPATGRLRLDLVPETAWGVNLRSLYPEHWDALRRDAYSQAGLACECCGARSRLECHEVWDSAPPVQRLVRLIALCADCHSSQHYGMARVRGIVDVVNAHLMQVNGWTHAELDAHVADAFRTMRERNKVRWEKLTPRY